MRLLFASEYSRFKHNGTHNFTLYTRSKLSYLNTSIFVLGVLLCVC